MPLVLLMKPRLSLGCWQISELHLFTLHEYLKQQIKYNWNSRKILEDPTFLQHGSQSFLSTHKKYCYHESKWGIYTLACVFDGPASCLLVSTASARRHQGEYLTHENYFGFYFFFILATVEDYWYALSSPIAGAFKFDLLWSSGTAGMA